MSTNGEVLLNGFSGEPSRFSCPRDPRDYADVKTNLFVLGSTIYFIMVCQDVFPDVSDQENGSDEEV